MSRTFRLLFPLVAAFLSVVSAWNIGDSDDRYKCQDFSKSPLDGCDKSNTVFVSAVPGRGNFTTVQSGKCCSKYVQITV